jgi:hypothetical protein
MQDYLQLFADRVTKCPELVRDAAAILEKIL